MSGGVTSSGSEEVTGSFVEEDESSNNQSQPVKVKANAETITIKRENFGFLIGSPPLSCRRLHPLYLHRP